MSFSKCIAGSPANMCFPQTCSTCEAGPRATCPSTCQKFSHQPAPAVMSGLQSKLWPGQHFPLCKEGLIASSDCREFYWAAKIQHSFSDIKNNPTYNGSVVIFLYSKMYVGKLWFSFKISYNSISHTRYIS